MPIKALESSAYYEISLESGSVTTFLLSFKADWRAENKNILEKSKESILLTLEKEKFDVLRIEGAKLEEWDTYLLAFLNLLFQKVYFRNIEFKRENLPEMLDKLLMLALAVPPRNDISKAKEESSFIESIGAACLDLPSKLSEVFEFLSETLHSFANLFKGKSKMYKEDLWSAIYECGANSLGIISLTSLLLGLILAFVGSIQLKLFGAEIYVASFVGLSMVRIMGALLTGIVLAGRTGANFAAIIGTMQVNEEVDALQTFGISPNEFLVMPRVIALTLMTPLLTLYANLMGMFGGYIVGILMLDIPSSLYIANTVQYMKLHYLWVGLFHAFVFGIVISLTGCYQGILCGRSAEAVGKATTSAVVVSLVGIIIATSIITVIFTTLGW